MVFNKLIYDLTKLRAEFYHPSFMGVFPAISVDNERSIITWV